MFFLLSLSWLTARASAYSSCSISSIFSLYRLICSTMSISTQLQAESRSVYNMRWNYSATDESSAQRRKEFVLVSLRCRLGDILHAEQGVGGVGAAQDTRCKHYGQRVGGHAVVSLFFRDPVGPFPNRRSFHCLHFILTGEFTFPAKKCTSNAWWWKTRW